MLAPLTEAAFGEQELLELNLEAARLWPRFAAEVERASGRAVGFTASGAIVVASDGDEARELRRLHDFQRSLDLDTSWLTGRDCRRLEPGLSPRVAGGILASGDGHADPAALVPAPRSNAPGVSWAWAWR
jgi:glycine oxidase